MIYRRKVTIIFIKLCVLTASLAGVYQLMDLFTHTIQPADNVGLNLENIQTSSPMMGAKKAEDAKTFYERLEKSKAESQKNQQKSQSTSEAKNSTQSDFAINTNRNSKSVVSFKMQHNRMAGAVKTSIVIAQQKVVAATDKTNAKLVSSSVGSSAAAQRVGGSPGEPLVTGSLPFGDGFKFLLLLCVGYTIRIFRLKI